MSYYQLPKIYKPATDTKDGLLSAEDKVKLDTLDETAPYVTGQSSSSTYGYRQWSDGTLEQWGYNSTSNTAQVAVTFSRPYTVTPVILITPHHTADIVNGAVVVTSTRSATGFTCDTYASAVTFSWHAIGH